MAVFSTNQNRHLYVVKSFKDFSAKTPETLENVGDVGVKTVGKGKDKELVFFYKGPGGNIKSDRIQVKNLDYVKAVKAADMRIPLKKVEVTVAADALDGSNMIAGQDYVLRIALRQFYGMSDEDQYFKDAAVHATANMSVETFYTKMVEALNLSFSREVGATKEENPYLKFAKEGSGDNAKIVITEKAQAYTTGIGAQERVYFEVVPTTVYVGADDVVWSVPTNATPTNKANLVVAEGATQTGIGNGAQIADLEYFSMGERGDQYRMAGWPNYIPTKYLADATQEYNALEIHHAFTDTGVNSYRSEKDITFVAADTETEKAALTSLLAAIVSNTDITAADAGRFE